MSRYFTFRFRKSPEVTRQTLVIFCHSDIIPSSLTKIIKDDIDTNFSPQDIIIFGKKINNITERQLTLNKTFTDEISSFIGGNDRKIHFLNFNNEGKINELLVKDTEFEYRESSIDLCKKIMLAGAKEIFKNRKGLITSLPSYHFVKPSGDHCDKFIRASNLFTSSVETEFLSISLLPYLKPNIKRIYVDTSSISFLVSIALQLSDKFNDAQPIIESFESYSVFKKNYNFISDDDSLVVISATTSGGLAKQLIKDTTFTNKNIITLFYSSIPEDQNGLYDISQAIASGIYSKNSKDCKLCRQGSKTIKIEGEQFIPETPKHELLVIRKIDFNKDRQDFFKKFATKGILKVNTGNNEPLIKEHFYIDIDSLFIKNNEPFKSSIRKKINKYFSIDIGKIIYINDKGSEKLADEIKKSINDRNFPIEKISYSDVQEEHLKDHSSVMVVISAITSGRQLLASARKLRGINPFSTITYMVGFSKLPTEESLEQLKKDLCLGGHELVILHSCYLPRYSEKTKTTWDIEKEKLSSFDQSDPFSEVADNFPLPPNLSNRLKLLEKTLSDDDLFLTSTNGEKLKLRNTFAFWSDLNLNIDDSTQADVYWTIQSILHDLRVRNDKGLATTYHSTLLSPVCFDRFNDGVIQSCLLRAAKQTELNYAVDEGFSRKITDIIISVVKNHDNPQGEACMEFLLSLWTKRLNIQEDHLEEIVELKKGMTSLDIKFLLENLEK
ncbi:hypothetical protein [Pectobacterium colocasium]|uniref:hypothetical protein n=1 Tax=Pectobacterium colocasium TaxID=2878098 RepID=UPI001CD7E40E|nr:hypothetical protein [Pectobacterium colocasium]